ncbi:hypothetical protein QUF64_09655 [Anaerolineales bacterium HSG6]|nr:hypothetical protein [Anaerolineales bacterium HSG6]
MIKKITHIERNYVLTEVVREVVSQRLKQSRPGHCLRINALPKAVMEKLCEQMNRNGISADVVLLLGPHEQPTQPWQVTATRLIELRNAENRPLLALVPPGLKAAAEDSFDVSTFVEIELSAITQKMRQKLRAELPESLQSLTDQVIDYLEKTERVINSDDIINYYLTILQNDLSEETAGGALYQLKLLPDFALFAKPDQLRQRLNRNMTVVQQLTDANQPLLGRIHNLQLKANTLQSDLYHFLEHKTITEVQDWAEEIVTNSVYQRLSFDKWMFEREVQEHDRILLYVHDPKLPVQNKKKPVSTDNPLYLDVRRQKSITIKWETDPKPALVQDLKFFRIEIVSTEGAVAWESSNIKATKGPRAYRSKSLKINEFKDQIEDGLYFFRVRAYNESSNILNEEEPEKRSKILRDPQNPAGKRIYETEDIWFLNDEDDDTPPPVEPLRNVSVHSFQEAQLRVQFDAAERNQDPFSEKLVPQTDKTYWSTEKSTRPGEAVYQIVYDAQAKFTLRVSNILRHIETETLTYPETLGRWQLNFHDPSSKTIEPTIRQFRDKQEISAPFLKARRALFATIQENNSDNLTSTIDLLPYQSLVVAYAQTYMDWLTDIQDNFESLAIKKAGNHRRTDPYFLDLDTVEIRLTDEKGQPERVYLLAPTHPLRMLWLLQRHCLAHNWLQKAIDTGNIKANLPKTLRTYLQRGLVSFNLPPVVRAAHDDYPNAIIHFYVEQGPLTPFWNLYVHEKLRDRRAMRARVQKLLGVGRQSSVSTSSEGITVSTLTKKLTRYLTQHPYIQTIKINLFNPGDAGSLIDAILGVERERLDNKIPSLRYELRLFTQSAQLDDIGEAIDELLNPERQVKEEADAFASAGQNHLFPKLKFSRNSLAEFLRYPENYEAHISVLHDMFAIEVKPEIEQAGRSSFLHGLIQELATHFMGDYTQYVWQRQLTPHQTSELFPHQTSEVFKTSDVYELDQATNTAQLLATLLGQIGNLQASVMSGKKIENAVPTLRLKLESDDKKLLYYIHTTSDWVFTIDRHLGLDYFDRTIGDETVPYLLDFTPEFGATDASRLILTTRSVDEVTRLISPVLEEHGLTTRVPKSDRLRNSDNTDDTTQVNLYFLNLLRSLSGRLAMKLVSSPTEVKEALGLAMARLFLEQYGLLNNAIVIPLDAHSNLFTEFSQDDSDDDISLKRGDLLLVMGDHVARNLHFHLIEVKWRTDLSDFDAYLTLRQEVEQQLQNSQLVLGKHFDPYLHPTDRIDRQLKTKQLITILTFYLERSARYGLVDPNSKQELLSFIESLDDGYRLTYASAGLIFDFSYQGISQNEEHAGLIFHRIGQDYIQQLVKNGVTRWQGSKKGSRRAVTIEETEQQQQQQQKLITDTSMKDDKSYERVRTHFRVGQEKLPPDTAKKPTVQHIKETPDEDSTYVVQTDTAHQSSEVLETSELSESSEVVEAEVSKISEVLETSEILKADTSPPTIAPDNQSSEVLETSELSAPCDILLGDTKPSQQYGILGKATDKIVGLDLNGTNTISLFGVQGGGKSYSVGSVVEMATKSFTGVNNLPSPLATVIFHYHESQDYPPEFVSMINPNTVPTETELLKQEYNIIPDNLDDVLILTSPGKIEARRAEFPSVQVEPLFFSAAELSFKDWRFLMGSVGNQMYMKQINMIMRELRGDLTLEALRSEIEESDLSKSQKRTARVRLDIAGQFIQDDNVGHNPANSFTSTKRRLSDWLKPGRLIIVDLRDEFIDRDEALGLFVVMLNIFANSGRVLGQAPFNKLIVFDEAHKYMNNSDLTSYIVEVIRQMRHQGVSVLIASQDPPSLPNAIIELSSVLILHRFNSPSWLKHIQRSITALENLTPSQMASLRPGEAYVWANKSTEAVFAQKAVKMKLRPRVTQHGGGTKKAV